jgi:hypothetical protein
VKENLRKKNAGARPVSSPDAETAALEKQATQHYRKKQENIDWKLPESE